LGVALLPLFVKFRVFRGPPSVKSVVPSIFSISAFRFGFSEIHRILNHQRIPQIPSQKPPHRPPMIRRHQANLIRFFKKLPNARANF
jgi:hypothetical protein